MKKVILVHCWTGYPEYCWYPYVKEELEKMDYEVVIPFFPDILPLLSSWLSKIDRAVEGPDEDTILIGHSLGAVAVLRYLETLPANQKIAAAILVSGFVNDLGFKPLQNFFIKPLDLEKIKQKADHFVVIASDNDPYLEPMHTNILRKGLDAKVIWKSSGHFTQTKDGSEYLEFPEIVSAIKKMFAKNAIIVAQQSLIQKMNKLSPRIIL